MVDEGPFGDHTGFYTPRDKYPAFHVTCVTRRRDAIYPATVVGRPPMEDAWLGKATERLFLPLLRMMLPELVDYNLPVEGVFHNMAIVAIDKQYPWHGRKIMHALVGHGAAHVHQVRGRRRQGRQRARPRRGRRGACSTTSIPSATS